MFGETVKTLNDVNKWTLKWDKPVESVEEVGGSGDGNKTTAAQQGGVPGADKRNEGDVDGGEKQKTSK